MKLICPKNKNHKRFEVSAHVAQTWTVDDEGQWIELAPNSMDEVVHHPDSQDYYTCAACGEEALKEGEN